MLKLLCLKNITEIKCIEKSAHHDEELESFSSHVVLYTGQRWLQWCDQHPKLWFLQQRKMQNGEQN